MYIIDITIGRNFGMPCERLSGVSHNGAVNEYNLEGVDNRSPKTIWATPAISLTACGCQFYY